MKKRTKILAALLLALLLPLLASVSAFAESGTAQTAASSKKEEVIYGTLTSDGALKNVYVINIITPENGSFTDYGNYSKVTNLTTTDALTYANGKVSGNVSVADGDRIYYEGVMEGAKLPWNFTIKYYLDGTEMTPAEIAGKTGHVKVELDASKNDAGDARFFENFALQISTQLDTLKCKNIKADGATPANYGTLRQLTYTVLPNLGTKIVIECDATEFEMEAFSINGVRMKLSITISDEEIAAQMIQLKEGITALDDGAHQLSSGMNLFKTESVALIDGIGQLNTGATQLSDGIAQLKDGVILANDGLKQLDSNSEQLTGGSKQISDALKQVKDGLAEFMDSADQMTQLLDGSKQVMSGIDQLADGVKTLRAACSNKAFDKLVYDNSGYHVSTITDGNTQAIKELDGYVTDLNNLYTILNLISPDNAGTVKELADGLKQIQTLLDANNQIIDAYGQYLDGLGDGVGQLYDGVVQLQSGYKQLNSGIEQLVGGLVGGVEGMTGLVDGITQLADGAAQLDDGLNQYCNGVAQLATGFTEMVDGITQVADGASQLASGMSTLNDNTGLISDGITQLADGASQLADGTGQFAVYGDAISDTASIELGALVSSIGGTTKEVFSYTSENNTNVTDVQFVLTTEAVKVENTTPDPTPKAELNFWQRLLKLFGLYKEN